MAGETVGSAVDGAAAIPAVPPAPRPPAAPGRPRRTDRTFAETVRTVVEGARMFLDGMRPRGWRRAAARRYRELTPPMSTLRLLPGGQGTVLRPEALALLRTRRPFVAAEAAFAGVTKRVTAVLVVAAFLVPLFVGWAGRGEGAVAVYSVTVLVFLFALLLLPWAFLGKVTGRSRAGWWWAGLVVSVAVGFVVAVLTGAVAVAPEARTAAVAVAATCVAIALAVVQLVLMSWNAAVLRRAWAAQHLEAAVVSDLLAVLGVLDRTRNGPAADGARPLQVTGAVWGVLEVAADDVRRYLPAVLDRRKPAGAAAGEVVEGAAAALLDLRECALLPAGRARQEDLDRVGAALAGWALGGVADLPRADPAVLRAEMAQRPWVSRRLLRRVAVGLVPLAALVGMWLSPVETGMLTDTLTPVAVTWLLVTVLGPDVGADGIKKLFGL